MLNIIHFKALLSSSRTLLPLSSSTWDEVKILYPEMEHIIYMHMPLIRTCHIVTSIWEMYSSFLCRGIKGKGFWKT